MRWLYTATGSLAWFVLASVLMDTHGKLRSLAGFTLVEIMIVVAIIGLIATMAIPSMMKARKRTQATLTLEDVRVVDDAKQQFAFDARKPGSFIPKVDDIRPYLKQGTRLYATVQLTNFRDMFGNPIVIGSLDTLPLIDDRTRDYFSDVVSDSQAFWAGYCR